MVNKSGKGIMSFYKWCIYKYAENCYRWNWKKGDMPLPLPDVEIEAVNYNIICKWAIDEEVGQDKLIKAVRARMERD